MRLWIRRSSLSASSQVTPPSLSTVMSPDLVGAGGHELVDRLVARERRDGLDQLFPRLPGYVVACFHERVPPFEIGFSAVPFGMSIHHSESTIYQAISRRLSGKIPPDNPGGNCVLCTRRRRGLDLLRQRGVAELLAVSLHVHVLGVAGVLHVAAQYDGGVLRVELHHVADAAELLAGHERGAGASEGVHDHGVLLRGVLDRVAQKVEGFAGRVILVALRLVVVPDGGLLAVGVPRVLAVLQNP